MYSFCQKCSASFSGIRGETGPTKTAAFIRPIFDTSVWRGVSRENWFSCRELNSFVVVDFFVVFRPSSSAGLGRCFLYSIFVYPGWVGPCFLVRHDDANRFSGSFTLQLLERVAATQLLVGRLLHMRTVPATRHYL